MKEEQASAKAQLTTKGKNTLPRNSFRVKEKGGLKRPPFFMGEKNAGKLCNIEKDTAIR